MYFISCGMERYECNRLLMSLVCKTAVIFIFIRMEITAVLCFLRKGVKLHFYSLGTILEENIRGVQRGETPWLWVSNRGVKHPCWHTILLAKSSVLYLLRPPHFAEMHWKGAVPRQTGTFRRQHEQRSSRCELLILWAVSYKRQGICHEQNPAVRV